MRRFATVRARKSFTAVALLGVASLLVGCQGSGGAQSKLFSTDTGNANGPVQLVDGEPTQSSDPIQALRQVVNEKDLAKAVERYRLNKKQQKSPYRSVGIDLDGDGQAEALTLLEGADWCASTGCTLAIFGKSPTGYRPLATIRRVRGPVVVTNERNNGWNDLVVNTGLASRNQRVRLRFKANGYPGNAVTLTPMPADLEVNGQVVIERVEILPDLRS